MVFVSQGAAGAVFSDGVSMVKGVAPRIPCHNPVGCGDALLAGFIGNYLRGDSVMRCVLAAVAAGTANALGQQPGAISQENFRRMKQKIRIKGLI